MRSDIRRPVQAWDSQDLWDLLVCIKFDSFTRMPYPVGAMEHRAVHIKSFGCQMNKLSAQPRAEHSISTTDGPAIFIKSFGCQMNKL